MRNEQIRAFELVISRVKENGYMDALDVKHLYENGIPIFELCIKSTSWVDLEQMFNEWLNNPIYDRRRSIK